MKTRFLVVAILTAAVLSVALPVWAAQGKPPFLPFPYSYWEFKWVPVTDQKTTMTETEKLGKESWQLAATLNFTENDKIVTYLVFQRLVIQPLEPVIVPPTSRLILPSRGGSKTQINSNRSKVARSASLQSKSSSKPVIKAKAKP